MADGSFTAQKDGSLAAWPGETLVYVGIAWHYVGDEGEERMFLDEDGEEHPDLDEVVIGAFSEERLARLAGEGYVKDHNGAIGRGEEMGHGRALCVAVHETVFNAHGTGHQVARYDVESGRWESNGRAAQATIPDAEDDE